MKHRHAAVVAIVVAVTLPGAASAIIEPNRGIAGVTLEMSRAQVEKALGPPVRVEKSTNDFGTFVNYVYRGLQVGFQGEKRVSGISTTRTPERTRGGMGVGTTEAALVKRIPALRCQTFSGIRTCTLGETNPGERVTDFLITKGKVSRVVVAIVID